jgi:hypothetical protein
MFVPSMTLEEIRKEIDKDFPIVYRKAQYVSEKLFRQIKPAKGKTYVKLYDYLSKHKNRWIYKIDISKHETFVHFMTYFYGKKGLVVFGLLSSEDSVNLFTSHFLNRYNERLNLNINKPEGIIHYFLTETPAYHLTYIETINDEFRKFFCVIPTGVILGIEDKKNKFRKMNTFLSNNMLKGNQVDLRNLLIQKLDEFIPDFKVLE